MTDFTAFNEWLWSCDPRLAVRVQQWHDTWQNKILGQHQIHATQGVEFIVDNRYRVISADAAHNLPGGLALYSLQDRHDSSPIAIYQSPSVLFSDLIAHSIRHSVPMSLSEMTRETNRLLAECCRAWVSVSGEVL